MDRTSDLDAKFPSTSWTLVARAVEPGRPALGQLVERYSPALRRFLCHRCRILPSQVDDILAGFIAKKVVELDLLSSADPGRGRLRSLLVASLRHYLIDVMRADASRQRAELVAARAQLESESTTQCAFDAEWARALLEEAIGRFRHHLHETDQRHLWELFEVRVLKPSRDGTPPIPYKELVERFGFKTATQACSAVTTAKRAFARTLRGVIAETCAQGADPEEVDDELRHLRLILSLDLPPDLSD